MNRAIAMIPLGALYCFGCASAGSMMPGADEPTYAVTDTATYRNELYEGEYALLRRNGVIVDSIDLALGLTRLNSGAVMFLPVRAVEEDFFPDAMHVAQYVIEDGQRRTVAAALLPGFDDYFSSPNVIDGIIYYWAWEPADESRARVFARRYDALRERIDSCYLYEDLLATDYRWYFAPPEWAGSGVRYWTYDFDAVLTPELTASEEGGGCRHHAGRE